MTRRESPGMVAGRLHLHRRTSTAFSLSWDALLDLAVDAYWARRNNVRPVVDPMEGEAGRVHHRPGDAA